MGGIKIIIVLSYRWHFSGFQTWSPLLVSSGKAQAKTLGNNSWCLNKIHYIKWDTVFLPPLFLGCFWTPPLPAVRWSLLYSSSWTNGPHLSTDKLVCNLPQLRARCRLSHLPICSPNQCTEEHKALLVSLCCIRSLQEPPWFWTEGRERPLPPSPAKRAAWRQRWFDWIYRWQKWK